MSDEILEVVADDYRARGPYGSGVVARTFLEVVPRHELELHLAALLDAGTIVPGKNATVHLSPAYKVSVLARPVIAGWLRQAAEAGSTAERLTMRGLVRGELQMLVDHCLASPESTGLGRRGVELAAVVAMADLDLRAMDVVGDLPGTVRAQLAAIRDEQPIDGFRSVRDLQATVRRAARRLADGVRG